MLSARIVKKLGGFTLDLTLEAGNEPWALLGASGSGKSMALRAIAGIVTPDEGRIEADGEVLYDSARGVCLPPGERRVGLMFQHYALFPNMTVEQNILCGLNRRERSLRRALADDWVERMQLTGQRGLYPAQLSGGQRQRVALARMLSSEPRLILLDEPFSALDSHLRWQLEREVFDVLRDFPGTALLVSHNRDEAYRLCNRIAVLDNGRVSASGERRALFDHPGTRAAAIMTGCKNVVRAEKAGPNLMRIPGWAAELESRDPVPDAARWAGVRARTIAAAAQGDGVNRLRWTAISHIEEPFGHILTLAPADGGEPIRWEMSREAFARLGDPSGGVLEIAPEFVHPLTD